MTVLRKKVAVGFVVAMVVVLGGVLPLSNVSATTTVAYTTASGTDTTSGIPETLTAGDVTDLQASDDSRIQSNGNWPDDGVYGEDNYIEFVFSPLVPADATILDVDITHEFRRGGELDAAKLEVWDGTSFTDKPLTLPPVSNQDFSETVDLTSELNTPAKVNGLIVRFLAYRSFGANTKTSHDVVGVTVVYNVPPVAADQGVTTDEDTATTITLGATDADVPGDALTYSIVTPPTGGSLGAITGNQVTYTPNANFNGADQLTFKANDGLVDSNIATVDVTVTPVNDAPVLDPIGPQTGDELAPLTFTATSADIDGGLPVYSLGGTVPVGAAIDPSTGTFTWTPTEEQGPDTYAFDVTVSDGNGGTDSETITVTVAEVNVAPVATDVSALTPEDVPVSVVMQGSDVDVPANTLTYIVVTGPTNGSLGTPSGNQATYTPNQDFNGSDSFTYKIFDGLVDSNIATATVTVTPINDAPVLDSIGAKVVDEEAVLNFTATSSDIDGGAPSYSLSGVVPTGAAIDPSTGTFTWTPTEEQGPDTYTFDVTVSDGNGGTDSETITVTVAEVNVAPVATDGSTTTTEDVAVVTTLSASDADVPANALAFSVVSVPLNGTAVVSGNQVTYTPNANFNGADQLTFKANDGLVDSNIATVDVTVTPVNDAPVLDPIGPQTGVAGMDGSYSVVASDVDGDALEYSLSGEPVGVSIDSLTGLLTWNLETAGAYTFDVTVSDGNGGTDSETITVTVSHAPIAQLEVSASPTMLSAPGTTSVTVVGKDEFGNVTTSDGSTQVNINVDNDGVLGDILVTLTNGVATTGLTKATAGAVNVAVSSNVLAPSGGTLTPDATAVFFVPADLAPAYVISHTPADDATDVAVAAVPHLTFSEPLKATTVNSTNIRLRKYSDDSLVAATVSLVEGGTQVNIDPTASLENGTQYYFAVSAGVQDEAGNALVDVLDAGTKAAHEFTTVAVVAPTGITVDDIIAQNTFAEATGNYLDGWHYTFRVTVNNTAETDLFVKFADWLNTASSSLIVPSDGNTRLLINEAGGVVGGVGLTESDIENGFGTVKSYALGDDYADQTLDGVPAAVDINSIDNSVAVGRQVQFDVFIKLPTSTAPGFYESSYGILTETQ